MTTAVDVKCFWCKYPKSSHFGTDDWSDANRRCPTANGYSNCWTYLPTRED